MATPAEARKGGKRARHGPRLPLADAEIDHDLARKPLERLAQVVEREAIGDAEASGRAKHLGAGEWLAFQAARELLDVDAEATQRLGHVAHDARPLATEDAEGDEPPGLFDLDRRAALDRDAQAGRFEIAKRRLTGLRGSRPER